MMAWILPRFRTMPSSFSNRATSTFANLATFSALNSANAFFVVGHFLSITFQFKPAWKMTRLMFSKYASSFGGHFFLYHHFGGCQSPSILRHLLQVVFEAS